MERNLASLQIIKNIRPIEKADRLEKANVEAFQVVIPKGLYQEGKLVVFFEADSFLPIEDRYSFLESSFKENDIVGRGYRIKVQKLRGEVTHGLVMSLKDFPEITNPIEGLDVTELLKVKKWEAFREDPISGNGGSSKPWFVPTTDEIRLQSKIKLIDELKGRPYYISTKIDGMSVTMFYKDNEFGITSRKMSLPESKNNSIWKYARKHDIENKLKDLSNKLGKAIIIQGEFAGPKIQSNNLGLKEYEWFIFNIFTEEQDFKNKLMGLEEFLQTAEDLNLKTVPIERAGLEFNMSLEELVEQTKGYYPNGHIKEGIVVRSADAIFSDSLNKELSFKVLNDDYWAQEK